VISLTQVWAGPLAARLMADFGAEVIKVESIRYPDRMRYTHQPKGDASGKAFNRGGYFHQYNRNKYGITLDLSKSKGKEIFCKLVGWADILVENYALRVQENLGITYPELAKTKPDIIMLSLHGYGSFGPYRYGPAFGSNIEAMSGLKSLIGYGDGVPIYAGACIGDPITAFYAVIAVMSALVYRQQTGKGQHIDLSMQECVVTIEEEALLEHVVNGTVPGQLGARHPYLAPYGSYRCQGDDSWIAICVTSEEEWQSLSAVIDNPVLKEDRFSEPLSRYQHQDELDKLIDGWTMSHRADEATAILQKAGIPAGAFLNGKEILQNTHLRERGYFWSVDCPDTGEYEQVGPLIHMSLTPAGLRLPPPALGQHNQYVLDEILGIPPEEIQALEQEGIIGEQPAY